MKYLVSIIILLFSSLNAYTQIELYDTSELLDID